MDRIGRFGLALVLAAAAADATAQPGAQPGAGGPAQGYPAKPIRIVVALAPGGGVDTSARIVGQKLTEAWGQQVVVENRPGAGGTIAAEMIARTAPDGYNLLMNSSGRAIAPGLYKLSYDAVKDFAPITIVALAPNVLVVHPSLPVRSLKELIAFARSHPDELLFSSSGNGSPPHLALVLLSTLTGVKMLHVPYKGTAPSITDLMGGRVSVSSASLVSTMPYGNTGRLPALATLGKKRSAGAPQVPTSAQAGLPGFEVDVWYAAFAPAGTPKEIVAKLYDEIARMLAQPDLRDRMLSMGLEPVGNPPEQFGVYLREQVAKWGKLIRAADIRVN